MYQFHFCCDWKTGEILLYFPIIPGDICCLLVNRCSYEPSQIHFLVSIDSLGVKEGHGAAFFETAVKPPTTVKGGVL